jgi:hypothetical protein
MLIYDQDEKLVGKDLKQIEANTSSKAINTSHDGT